MGACSAMVEPGELVDSAVSDLQGTRTVVGDDTSDSHFAQERAFRIGLLHLEATRRKLLWMAQMHATKGMHLWQQEQMAAMSLDLSAVDDVASSCEVPSMCTLGSSACSSPGVVGGVTECPALHQAVSSAKTYKRMSVPHDAQCLACWFLAKTAVEGKKPHPGNHAHTCVRSRRRGVVPDSPACGGQMDDASISS